MKVTYLHDVHDGKRLLQQGVGVEDFGSRSLHATMRRNFNCGVGDSSSLIFNFVLRLSGAEMPMILSSQTNGNEKKKDGKFGVTSPANRRRPKI